jgi:hypothetical protein
MWRPLCLLFLLTGVAPLGAEEAPKLRPWTFAYVMSYDNDLAIHAESILSRIADGVGKSDVAVTVLADLADTGGLQRHRITAKEGRVRETLETEDSASETVVRDYLDWVAATFPAKRYGVVFLDHGGGLDEMCLDRRPGGKSTKQWLSARKTGPMLKAFRDRVKAGGTSDVELLFLQQCGRGSIENLYNFRGAARAVLASQARMGAPNDYYRATFLRLGRKPDVDGFEVADGILWDEEQFTSLVCVDGAKLAGLPARLDPVVEELLAAPALRAPAAGMAALCFRSRYRKDETLYDLLHWFEQTYAASALKPATAKALAVFRKWVETELIVHHRKHPLHRKRIRDWTGLGLFVPVAETVRGRYPDDYPLYAACGLSKLMKKLYPKP